MCLYVCGCWYVGSGGGSTQHPDASTLGGGEEERKERRVGRETWMHEGGGKEGEKKEY